MHTQSFTASVQLTLDHPWYGVHHSFIPKALTGLSGELTLSGFAEDSNNWVLGFDTSYWGAQQVSHMQVSFEMMKFTQSLALAIITKNN